MKIKNDMVFTHPIIYP
jgi:hypothetical protein